MIEKKIFKTLVFFLVFTFVITFALMGCKDEIKEQETEESVVEEQETEESVAEEEVEEKEPVKLVFWDFGGAYAGDADKPVEERYIYNAFERYMEQNPYVTFEYTTYEGTKSTELLTAAGISGTGPDFVNLWAGNYIDQVKDGFILLNDYLSQEEIDCIRGWDETNPTAGEYYAVPNYALITSGYYKKSLMEEAGITDLESEYDGTYSSFLELCEKIKNAGIIPMYNGFSDGYGGSWVEGTLFASQFPPGTTKQVILEIMDKKRNFVDTPEAVNAWLANQEFYEKGYLNTDCISLTASESRTNWLTENSVIFPGTSGSLEKIRGVITGEELGVMQLPSWEANSPSFGVTIGNPGSHALAVTNYGNIEESLKFIMFLKSAEEEKEYIKLTKKLPSRKKECGGDYNDVMRETEPLLIDFNDVLENYPTADFLDNSMLPEVSATWFKLEPLLVTGEITIVEFLESLDAVR